MANPFDDIDPRGSKAAATPASAKSSSSNPFDDIDPSGGAVQPAEPDMGGGAAALQGAKAGLTYNFNDEIAGARAAAPKIPGTDRDIPDIVPVGPIPIPARTIAGAARVGYEHLTGGKGEGTAAYEAARDEERKQSELAKKQHPYLHGAGEVAGSIPSMAALPEAGFAKAAAAVRPYLKGAQVGAEYGAVAGAGEGKDLDERLTSAGVGSVVGGGVGAIAPVLGAVVSKVIGQPLAKAWGAYRGWKDPGGEAARRISTALAADEEAIASGQAKGLTQSQWMAAKAAGEPVMLADLGAGNTQALLRSAANTSPSGWAHLEKALEERFHGQTERVASDIKGLVAGGANARKTADQIVAEYDVARVPAYKKAYEEGDRPIFSRGMEKLLSSDTFVGAMKRALSSGRDRDVTMGFGGFNPKVSISDDGRIIWNRGADGMPVAPNLQYWDAVKKELDAMANMARRSGDTSSSAGDLAKMLRGELDKVVPSYKNARGIAEDFFGEKNALEAGRSLAGRKMEPEALRDVMKKMSPEERELFREGYASDWADRVIKNISDTRDITKAMFNSPNERARALAVFGEAGVRHIQQRMVLESIFQGAKNAMGNSSTAKQLIAAGLAGGALGGYETGWDWKGITGGAGASMIGVSGVKHAAGDMLASSAKKVMGAVDSRTAQHVAELLTSDDHTLVQKGIEMAMKNRAISDGLRRIADRLTLSGGSSAAHPHAPKVNAELFGSKAARAEDEKRRREWQQQPNEGAGGIGHKSHGGSINRAKGGAVRIALKALKDYADGGEVEDEPADHGLSKRQKLSPLEKAISPITAYPETYSRMNREAREQMAHGYDQIGQGPLKSAMGVGNMALGAMDYTLSPINAAYRTVVGQPIEDVTGIPREGPELIGQLATPGIGFAQMGRRGLPKKASGGPLSSIMKVVEGAMEGSAARRAASEEAAAALKSREVPPTSEVPKGAIDERPIPVQETTVPDLGGGPAAEAAGDVAGGLGGSAGRGASLDEAAAAATRWAGERRPIEGLPVKPQYIEGHGYLQPGPIGSIHDIAENYMRAHRPEIKYAPPTEFRPVDSEHAKSIAQAFEEMKHEPDNPAVRNAYEAMIDETAKQYQAIKASGLKIEPIPVGMPDPYAKNPRLAAHDVAENNHLWFFPTEGGFGTVNKISDNPMLRPTGEKIGDHEMLANDMFRVVHDVFGHLQHGHGFRAAGEDNAWRSHSAMYSDIARPAMTSETRGQNSWVNYGPNGEKNRTASGADTVYADQKVGLMPDWAMYDKGNGPIEVYTGSPHSYGKPSLAAIGKGEGNQAYGHGLYAAGHEPVAERYRIALSAMQDPLLKKFKLQDTGHVIGAHLADAGGDAALLASEYAKMRDNLIKSGPFDKASENLIKDYDQRIKYLNHPKRATGHMYKQGLEAKPEQLLDYDNPFHKQSGYVQDRTGPGLEKGVKEQIEAIEKSLDKGGHGNPASKYFRRFREKERQDLEGRLLMLQALGHSPFEGKEIYKRIGLPARDPGEMGLNASARLREMGIPAMRYLDAGSRTSSGRLPPKSTHNYVVFDDDKLRIHRKYEGGGAVAGIHKAGGGPLSGLLRGFESMMEAAPARKAMEEAGSAVEAMPRRPYAEPEYAPSGRLITDKGVENPPNPDIQTVADPHRMMYPGIYRNPRVLAEEAAAAVGPEDPALKQLFGVTRGDMREMAQGRVGNETPNIHGGGERSRGSLAAQNIQTPQNAQRLLDILHEAGKHEGLRTADAWYLMDPAFQRLVEMFGKEEAVARYRHLNTMTGMASPSADVIKEIQRGTAAHWLDKQGRFDDFRKYAGIPEDMRSRVQFPDDMRAVPGHAYHMTAHTGPMSKYLDKGFIDSKKAKVPLYVHASGVPETGFQTIGPVGDAHFSRGVGLADTRKGPSNVGGSFSSPEYHTLQPWWQHEVAGAAGMESVPAQARLWTGLGPQTGVESALGAPKLELLAKQIMEASRRLRISPEKARDLVLSGGAGAFLRGGRVSGIHALAG